MKKVQIAALILGLVNLRTELQAKWDYDSWDTLRVTGATAQYQARCVDTDMEYPLGYLYPILKSYCKTTEECIPAEHEECIKKYGEDFWRRLTRIKKTDCESGEIYACNDGRLHCGQCNE